MSIVYTKPNKVKLKRNEDIIIEKFKQYVYDTYSQHYEGDLSPLDMYKTLNISKEAYTANILKYAVRYNKKGNSKKDIFKLMHYAVLLYAELENE